MIVDAILNTDAELDGLYVLGGHESIPPERLCRDHLTFIDLSGDTAPHFTPLAAFVSSLGEDAAQRFAQVLYLCNKQGLIGRQRFAIDGAKTCANGSEDLC